MQLNRPDAVLVAYYYQDPDDIDDADGDLGNLDWAINGYDIF